jgi:hypothetical protein
MVAKELAQWRDLMNRGRFFISYETTSFSIALLIVYSHCYCESPPKTVKEKKYCKGILGTVLLS